MAAVVLTALALAPSAAHLLEMPVKIALPQSTYMIVQGLYAGWWIGGVVWAMALLANLGLALTLRRQGGAWRAALAAAGLIAACFAVFLGFTQPANIATANWSMAPPDWPKLRRAWEWSHAANAGLLLLALFCSARAAVLRPVA